MTPMRARAAALALAVTALLGAACSSSGDGSASLPTVGTQAPNSPPGSLPDDTLAPPDSLPAPSGDPGTCPAAPYPLTVRTASGDDRSIAAPAAWALYVSGASTWLFVTGDVDLTPATLRDALPDPAGRTLVLVRLTATTPAARITPLAAGDTFAAAGSSEPDGRPVADLQVRTGAGQAPATGPLSGSVTVDAVTAEGVCLSVDLRREGGAQVKGSFTAPFLKVNPGVLSS